MAHKHRCANACARVGNIHDHNGRLIAQLENAEQTAGSYQYVWDASGLPAGTYHYSLIVDGELLVKRAIKLQD